MEDALVISSQVQSSLDENHKHNPIFFLISIALCTFNFRWLVFKILCSFSTAPVKICQKHDKGPKNQRDIRAEESPNNLT